MTCPRIVTWSEYYVNEVCNSNISIMPKTEKLDSINYLVTAYKDNILDANL